MAAPSSTSLAELAANAATVWERLEQTSGEVPELDPGLVVRLLAPWSKATAGGDLVALLRRLAWDGVDPRRAAAALAEAPPALPEPPAWTGTLTRYATIAAGGAHAPARDESDLPYAELWHAWVELAIGEGAIERRPVLTDGAWRDLELAIGHDLAGLSGLAVHELFERRRQEDGRPGAYRRFVERVLADPVTELYDRFPTLARQTCERVRQWRQAVDELQRRFERDRPAIAECFTDGVGPGPVVAVAAGLSDRHRDGRQVLGIETACGLRLAYKPRSVTPEARWSRLLDRFRELGLGIVPPAACVLERESYGWIEWLEPGELVDEAAVDDYYRRAGALVALAWILGSQDLHAENLIGTASGPVLIDAEMLLQPQRRRLSTGERALGLEAEAQTGSCLDSGLLTQLLGGAREDRSLGGLRAIAERPRRGLRWSGIGTDSLRVEESGLPPLEMPNAPRRGSGLARPEDASDALLEGFRETGRFLLERREVLLGPEGLDAALVGTPVRVLFRASEEYGRVLRLCQVPRNQRSGLTGSWLREALLRGFSELVERPRWWPLIAEERRALEAGDVPWLALPVEATRLELADGQQVEGAFERSALEVACQRLQALDEGELDRQAARLRDALEPAAVRGPLASVLVEAPRSEAAEPGPDPRVDRCRRVASAIADELLTTPVASPGWDLAEGRAGLALTLAAMGDPRCDRAALELVAPWLEAAPATVVARADSGSELPTTHGGLSGLGSTLWSLVWLARSLRRPELAEVAAELLRRRLSTLDGEDVHDVDRGLAGTLLGALAVAQALGDEEALGAARRCGEGLLAAQRVVDSSGAAWINRGGLAQAGFAHGAAGTARALGALATAIGDERFLVGAVAALGWERSVFDAERGNWPVYMVDAEGRRERDFMVAWCRGAPGVALARLYLPSPLRDAATAEEVGKALETTAAAPLSTWDHLCCGNLGRISVLVSAADRGAGAEWRSRALSLVERVLERAGESGALILDNDPYENRRRPAGFLKGTSGVAYTLLRLVEEGELPDPLALELPAEHETRETQP